MSKKLKKKPLQKYQEGGENNPFAMFQGSGLNNPFASGINYNLFGQLQPTSATQQFQNFSADNFGQQIGQAATSTAASLGQIPGMRDAMSPMPEWGGEYAQKMKQDIAKEKGLTYNSWTGKWKNDKGEVYTNKELEDLAGMRYDEQKAQKERNKVLAPLATPLLMLNELGEAQKRSYAQAQKESMYDVSRGPSAMESRGFFAKHGGNISRLQQMLGYNIPKAQNSLNTGYSWDSPSSQSAAKVAPPSKSNYATNYTESSSDLKNKPLPQTKEERRDTFSRTYHGFSPSKGIATIDNSIAQTSIPQTQKESDIQKTYRELEDAIKWQKKYINSLDVRDRLINQIGKFNPDKSRGQVIDLVDERINQYKKNLEGIEYKLYNQEDTPNLGYQDPVNNSVHLSNTLKNPGSVAIHEIRHAFDQLNSKFSDIFESNTRYRVPLDEVRNVQAPYSPGGEFYNKDAPILKNILDFESSNDPWVRIIIPYYKRFNEKTARMSQLRKRADELGLHKGGANISKEKFNSVIEQLLDDNEAWSVLLELMSKRFGGLNKNEIFRLWNETVDVGDNNSYDAQVENNQNPIISAKQGMRTPPVTEVYRMMGAHQGLPETSYKLASVLNFKTAKKYEQGAYVKMLDSLLYEEGGPVNGKVKEDSVRNLTEEEISAFNSAKQRLVDYVNSPQWEDRFVKMQMPEGDVNKKRSKDFYKNVKEDMSYAREAILSNLNKSTPLIVKGDKIQNQAGMFDPDKGFIYINQDFSGPGEIQNVLLHELGHSATDPNTEYVASFIENVTKRGRDIDPQSMQKFFSYEGKPLPEMDIAYTMEKEIPVLVNTLRGKADEYGILRYGEDFTPDALNKLLEVANTPTGGTDPAADRDREFLKNQIQYLQSMLKGDQNTLLQTLNTIAAADTKGQAPYYNAKNGARISQLLFNSPQKFQNSGKTTSGLKTFSNDPEYFNNRTFDDWQVKLLSSGNFGIDPKTDAIVKLKSPVKVPQEWIDIAGKNYKGSATQRRFQTEAGLKQAYQNPVMYAPGLIGLGAGAGAVLKAAAPAAMQVLNTPMQVAGRTLSAVTPANLITSAGIAAAPENIASGVSNIRQGNYVQGAADLGTAVLDVYVPEALNVAKPLSKLAKNIVGLKPSKNFKSEIDWAKWNPDTPKYPELINEYNAIEEATKKSGTWMKNPDGSAFQGTPEQFIQQQSSWFKKAFPNVIKNKFGSPQLNYHGSPSKFSEISPDKEVNGRIYGEGLYTTPNLDLAKSYAVGDNPQLYEFYINANNPRDASNYIQEGIAKADEKLNKILKEFGENSKEYKKGLDEYNEELEYLRKNRTKIDLRKHSIGEAEDYMRVKDVQVTPFDNRVKSAIGNVGFFDMTNPNIYKALLPAAATSALLQQDDIILNRQQGGNVTNAVNSLEQIQKIQNNMYNNNQRVSKLAMLLGGGLIRGYQEGGMQQPMSPEEEQMMMQAMQEQQAMQQPQQQPMPQQGGEMEQEGEGGQNKYMQLPPEQQAEVYKQIIDFILENGIDALEQQFPEEYQFFEEFSDKLEGEDMEEEGEQEGEGEGEMETEAGRMQMGGGEMGEEEMQSEYPTDEEEVPVGARPGENAMRPAQPMPGAQQMKEGGIPERYRKMGFTKVGQKRQSDRPGKRWMVLAKKGDQYKVVHGGDPKMQDYTQHRNKNRQENFWSRHGGKNSAKANDKFSPLYWAKNGFTNAGPTW